MNLSRRVLLFLVLAAAQLVVPAWVIHTWENTLREGQQFKFRTAPVDPYDAFRGRYVALRIESNSVPPSEEIANLPRGSTIYASIAVDPSGFAHFDKGSVKPFASEPYMKARVWWASEGRVQMDLPIDRFYMNEKLAPRAQQAYVSHSTRTNRTAYVLVRVKNGLGVVEDLYIDDEPVTQYLKKSAAGEPETSL